MLHKKENPWPVRNDRSAIALIPAAGRATRLPEIRHSKELTAVTLSPEAETFPVIDYLLDALGTTRCAKTIIITRKEKSDLRAHLAARRAICPTLETRLTPPTPSVPHTLLAALPGLGDSDAVLAFPDILFHPGNAPAQLLDAWAKTGSDVLLGAMWTERGEKSDLIEQDADGSVNRIIIKDKTRAKGWSWIMAVWNPAFSRFLTDWIANQARDQRELQLGCAMIDALAGGLRISAHRFADGHFVDIGTPEDLARLRRDGL